MKKICVYSGSNAGTDESYKKTAQALGALLAKNEIELIYGGSTFGLMGAVSNEVLKCGGKVTGVLPRDLFPDGIVNQNLTTLIQVEDMYARKQKMAELADGFIALPGGLGTYEEVFEMMSHAQLSIHHKPIGFLNVMHFFDPLFQMLDHTIDAGFMQAKNRDLFCSCEHPEELLLQMKQYQPPILDVKWEELKQS